MKQKLKLFVWLIPILLFCLYWLGIYLSLKNPMEEIVYSENGGLMRYVMFKPYTETIGSDRIWKEWVYRYKYQLKENVSVRLMFKYNSKKRALIQEEAYLYVDDQTVEGSEFLQKLSTYGKDRTWLKNQSKKVAEQYILGTWFKNGSSRYSLKNLGDMKIEYNELLEEK